MEEEPLKQSIHQDEESILLTEVETAFLRRLLAECLEAYETKGDEAVEAACRAHPDQAEVIRRRITCLRRRGLLVNSPEEHDFTPPEILGDFRIYREIGRGGMGTVYEAEQISMKRKVALKVLPAHLSFSTTALTKFRREAEAGGRQSHRGIVAIYAVGEHEGVHYIAQELVEGSYTLEDRLAELRSSGEHPPGYFREAARLTAEIADALQRAHESGVLHRDVKPSNILLTREGCPKLTDFGLAKIQDALALSRSGDLAGTPYYMSPEQAASRRIGIDHRTDIYSLGVTLYEILTLKRPFEGETSQEVLKKILLYEPLEPWKVNPRVPRDLAVICLKAMEKKPDARYASMRDFSGDLERFLSGDAIHARPAGMGIKAWKRIKRNPASSAAVAMTLAALLSFLTYGLWSYPRILKEAEKTAAINAFLEEILSSADPGRDGREVKVVEVLDKAAGEIDTSFRNQPEIEASLRNTIGSTYWKLGLYEPAERQHRKELDIRRRILGGEHPETLASLNHLSCVLMDRCNFSEAESLIRENLGERLRIFGEQHPEMLNSLHNLAYLNWKQGRFADAEVLLRRVVENRRLVLGGEHEDTLVSMNNLALVLESLGKAGESLKLHEQVLDARIRVLGEDHPDTLQSMNNLALAYRYQGKRDQAVALLRKVCEKCRQVLGHAHPNTLTTMNNLASALRKQGNLEEAESLLRDALAAGRSVLGEEHLVTLQSMNNLAAVLRNLKRHVEAEALYRQLISTAQESMPPDCLELAKFQTAHANCLVELDRYPEAEAKLLAALPVMEASGGARRGAGRNVLRLLIKVYDAMDMPDKARTYRTLLQSPGRAEGADRALPDDEKLVSAVSSERLR